MIVVWNCQRGQTYGFADLDAYKAFASATEGSDRSCWDDAVHDVGAGGEASEGNQLALTEFNASIS